jgi:hypothetical protein
VPGASLSNLPVSWDGTVDVYVDARVWATGAAGAYVGCQLWLRSGGGGWLTSDLVESNVFAGSTRHASGLMMGGFVTYKLSLYAQTGTCILQEAKLWVTIR